jgi:hypothetical protein
MGQPAFQPALTTLALALMDIMEHCVKILQTSAHLTHVLAGLPVFPQLVITTAPARLLPVVLLAKPSLPSLLLNVLQSHWRELAMNLPLIAPTSATM